MTKRLLLLLNAIVGGLPDSTAIRIAYSPRGQSLIMHIICRKRMKQLFMYYIKGAVSKCQMCGDSCRVIAGEGLIHDRGHASTTSLLADCVISIVDVFVQILIYGGRMKPCADILTL